MLHEISEDAQVYGEQQGRRENSCGNLIEQTHITPLMMQIIKL